MHDAGEPIHPAPEPVPGEPALVSDADLWAAAYAAVHNGAVPPDGWTVPAFRAVVDDGTGLGATPVQCPFCREQIRSDAVVCKHCRRDVAPQLPELLEAYHLHTQYRRLRSEQEDAAEEAARLADAEARAAKRARRRQRNRVVIPAVVIAAVLVIGGGVGAGFAIAGEAEREAQSKAAAEEAERVAAEEAKVAAEEAKAAADAEAEQAEKEAKAQLAAQNRPAAIAACRSVYDTEEGWKSLSPHGHSLESICDRMTDSSVMRWVDPEYAARVGDGLRGGVGVDGFWKYLNSNTLSGKWLDREDPGFGCDGLDRCFNLLVRTTRECPGGVAVEMSVNQANTGVVLSRPVNLTPPLGAGETAKLVFGIPPESGEVSGHISDMDCL
ncbi:hypothetical protein FLP10_06905 [Agromyces intestinalis]|uniref:Zinc ribbon domain-containing protein n=1 Tax=Agromyces intestinalis TaxID=2592652 RepID=A0A5C1YER4_9MICO|nr:hypothetical protein [Agromyces intestinalis]QEO14178.1 hypothetical protein FLP10_06905 [Agromyces intestinalis]